MANTFLNLLNAEPKKVEVEPEKPKTNDTFLSLLNEKTPTTQQPSTIQPDNFKPEEGWLDQILSAMDYAGNISRSTIKHGLSGGIKAATKDLYTSPTEIKDLATEGLGLGKVRVGKDDGSFDWGDVADFGLDFAVDVATDPLSLVSMGLGNVAKGGKLAKAMPGLQKAMTESKLGLATKGAADYAKFKDIAATGLGATYGAGLVSEDGSPLDRAVGALAGGGAALLGKQYLPKVGEQLRKGMDWTTDWYATTTRGSKFKDITLQRKIANDAYAKTRSLAEEFKQGRFRALEGLSDEDYLATAQFQKDYMSEFVKARNKKTKELDQAFGITKTDSPKLAKQFEKIKDTAPYKQALNKIDQELTDTLDKTWVPARLAKESETVRKATNQIAQHNDEMIKKFNREYFGLESGRPNAEGTGIFGIKYHTGDPFEKTHIKRQIRNAEETLGKAKIFRATRINKLPAKTREMEDLKYGVYAENWAKKFLNETERTAQKMVAEYYNTIPKQIAPRSVERVVKTFDKFQNFVKMQLLYFSTSWVKNNYFDNLGKAYVQNGLPGILGTGSLAASFRSGVSKDIFDMYRGKLNRVYSTDDMKDMVELGVLNTPLMKAITDEDVAKYIYSPAKLAEMRNNQGIGTKAIETWRKGLDATVGQVGSWIEGTARAATYIKTKQAIEKAGLSLDPQKIKEVAAKVSRETFFDYGDISHFEQAVIKRIVPFYSFYSKNLPYWVKAMADPERAGRIMNIEKIRHGIGSEPSERDKQGMSDYLLTNAARSLGKNVKGDKVFGIVPSFSFHDALQMVNPQTWRKQIEEKLSPLLKTPLEAATGKDFFTGGPLYASQTGRKFMFSRGYKHIAIRKALEAAGIDPDETLGRILAVNGVKIDKRGNPFGTKDGQVLLDRIYATLFPMGFVEQLAGSVGKTITGKETPTEAIINRLAPMQTVKVSPRQEAAVRKAKRTDLSELRQLLEKRKKQQKERRDNR